MQVIAQKQEMLYIIVFIAESSAGLSKATVLERKKVVILMHVLLFIVDPRKRFKCFL